MGLTIGQNQLAVGGEGKGGGKDSKQVIFHAPLLVNRLDVVSGSLPVVRGVSQNPDNGQYVAAQYNNACLRYTPGGDYSENMRMAKKIRFSFDFRSSSYATASMTDANNYMYPLVLGLGNTITTAMSVSGVATNPYYFPRNGEYKTLTWIVDLTNGEIIVHVDGNTVNSLNGTGWISANWTDDKFNTIDCARKQYSTGGTGTGYIRNLMIEVLE